MSAPPRGWRALVRLACRADDLPFVLADLDEGFERVREARGRRAARRWYASQAVRSVGPCLLRRVTGPWTGFASSRDLAADARYAIRRLVRTPAQVAITVVSLGVGIGLVTAVFAVGNAFLLQEPAGVLDPEGLVAVWTSGEDGDPYQPTSFPDFRAIADEVAALDGVTAVRSGVLHWERGETSERLIAEIVTGNYFDVLGVRMPLGRGFLPEETVVGRAEQVAVISHDVWHNRFAADPGVLGSPMRINGRDFTVVGVAPEGLLGRFLRLKVGVWVPLGLPGGIYHATPGELEDRRDREFLIFGRLEEGADEARVQASADVLADRLYRDHAEVWSDDRGRPRVFTVTSLAQAALPPSARTALVGAVGLFLAGCGLVLLIACVNVAGLFLARASRRWREVAVRLSLGAGRGRVVRLLLVEALLLALVGGAAGVWLAVVLTSSLAHIPLPLDVPLSFGVSLDVTVLVFALLVSLAVCVAFGLLPALQTTRPALVSALKGEGPAGARRGFGGLRGGLVVAQVAGSVLLLVASGLAVRNGVVAARLEHGIDPDGLALASSTVRGDALTDEAMRSEALLLAGRVAARPEIERVEVASVAELSVWVGAATARIDVPGFQPGDDDQLVMPYNAVTPGYFDLVGLRASAGRLIEERDAAGAPPVAVVNRSFAARYFGGEAPLGRRFTVVERRTFSTPRAGKARAFEIVGVVPDVRASTDQEGRPFFWTSFHQDPTPITVLHVRSRAGVGSAVAALRDEVVAGGDELQLVPPQSYDEAVSVTLLPQRLASRALGWAGGFALLLSLIGIYGVVSFAVSCRAREMAIRQAIGAGAPRVLREVVSGGMRLALVGAGVGLALVIPAAYVARSMLVGVSPVDPAALAGGVGVLMAGALAATLAPALRVLSLDPMVVLRDD